MEKKCFTCKYEGICFRLFFCPVFMISAILTRMFMHGDSKQLWSELVQMYCRALGGNEKIDYDIYDIQCDRFREKLSELYETIREECW